MDISDVGPTGNPNPGLDAELEISEIGPIENPNPGPDLDPSFVLNHFETYSDMMI